MVPAELTTELLRLSQLLEQATTEYCEKAIIYAAAEDDYRQDKAVQYARLSLEERGRERKERRTVNALEADRDILCQKTREAAHMAEALKDGARQRVESLRAQLSACQSVANAVRAELQLVRGGTGAP